jgi:hypothetical protein
MNGNGDAVVALLEELVTWTKVGFYGAVKDVLDGALNDDKKRLIYVLADGTRTAEQIRVASSTSPNKVGECLRNWERVGLVITLPNGNRKHKFDPSLFGLNEG